MRRRSLKDLVGFDPALLRSLRAVEATDFDAPDCALELYFTFSKRLHWLAPRPSSTDAHRSRVGSVAWTVSRVVDVPLVVGGDRLRVGNGNKRLFVRLLAYQLLLGGISSEVKAMQSGVLDVINFRCLHLLTASEVGGRPDERGMCYA